MDRLSQLHALLATVTEPLSGLPLTALPLTVSAECITLGYFNQALLAELRSRLDAAGLAAVAVRSQAPACVDGRAAERLRPVRAIIAVASGKGGVGKSATAVNLALALKAEGARVGLLDADIYGPSLPIMLGKSDERVHSPDGTLMAPLFAHGLACNSLGFLMDPQEAAVWRGPMASAALKQLFNDTLWPELDYLVVDLPPGTGDIPLTLAQAVPVSTAVVVTTPQNLALADARRGVAMFTKVHVPVCGVVENMSYFVCGHCGTASAIFGDAGGAQLAAECGVPVLGQIPLDPSIRADADGGLPTVARDPDHPVSRIYRTIGQRVGLALWQQQAAASALSIAID